MRSSRLLQTCFFTKRFHTHKKRKKHKKHQTQANNFNSFKKVFARAKSCFLCYFLFAYFCFGLRVFLCTYFSFVSLFLLASFLHLFIKKSNKQVWSWWPHLPILLTWLLSTSLWKIHLYTLIFICLNLWLFVIIFEDFFFLRESLSVSDHHENLSLFKIIMRILPIYDHYENLSLFIIIYENHFFMKIFIICKNFF